MTERQIHLTGAYFDGAATPAEFEELLAALQADPAFLEEFRQEWETHWLLRNSHPNEQTLDLATKRILHYVRAQGDSASFLEKVKARIEPRATQPRVKLRPRWPLAAAAAIALVGITAFVFSQFKSPPPVVGRTVPEPAVVATISEAAAGAKVRRNDVEILLQAGAELRAGERLIAPASSKVSVRSHNGSVFEMNRAAEIEFTEPARNSVHVFSGDVLVSAAPAAANAPLIISSAAANATVVGTRFEVSVHGELTTLRVEEGLVRFGKAGPEVTVAAREASQAAVNTAPIPVAKISAEDIAPWRSGTAAPRNILGNGSFQDDFSSWTVRYPKQGKPATVGVASERLPEGKKSVFLPIDSMLVLSQEWLCRPGEKYTAEAKGFLRIGEVKLAVTFVDANGNEIETKELEKLKQPRADFVLKGELTAPASAARIRYLFISTYSNGHLSECSLVRNAQ